MDNVKVCYYSFILFKVIIIIIIIIIIIAWLWLAFMAVVKHMNKLIELNYYYYCQHLYYYHCRYNRQ
jgi:hypothetical protein